MLKVEQTLGLYIGGISFREQPSKKECFKKVRSKHMLSNMEE